MSDADALRDRLYVRQQKPRRLTFLRPKNKNQISPGLNTARPSTQMNDPIIPSITIPTDINSKKYSLNSASTMRSQSTANTGRVISSDLNSPLYDSTKPLTAIIGNRYNGKPIVSMEPIAIDTIPITPSQNTSRTSSEIKVATSRSKAQTVVPYDVRPSTAIDKYDSRISKKRKADTSRVTSINTVTPRPLSAYERLNGIRSRRKTDSSRTNKVEIEKPVTSRSERERTDNTPRSIFRLKKSNLAALYPEDFETFRRDEYYTSVISDELWCDPKYIFYYIRLIKQKKLDEEFLYFHSTPATSVESENVYFLTIVSPSDVNWENYYTLSSDGVTSYKKNKVEFTQIKEWLHEVSIFIQLKEIPFFNHYEKWRSFTLLHCITRNEQISGSRNKMTNELFVVTPALRGAVIDLQSVCGQILKLSLVDVKSSQTLTLEQFVDRQASHLREITVIIQNLIEKARSSIVQSCDIVYESTDLSTEHKKKKKKQSEELQIQEKKDRKNVNTMKSMSKNKNDIHSMDMLVYTQLATQRFCHKRLSRFIRLCDYMLVHSLYTFVIQSITDLVNFLAPRTSTSQGGDITRLSTKMIVKGKKLSFSPDINETRESIIDTWNNLVSYVFSIALFSEHPTLTQYSSSYGWSESVVPLNKIVHDSNDYKNLYAEVQNRIEKAYNLASEKILDYQQFLESYLRNIAFDIEKVRESDPPAQFFGEQLSIYKTEIDDMDNLERQTNVDMLLIVLSGFCDMIKPTPRKCLSLLNTAIPTIAEKKVEQLTDTVTEALHMLKQDPTDVHFFVTQLEFRRKTYKEFDQIDDFYASISEFYSLITKSSISCSDDSIGAWKSLGHLINQLEGLLAIMNDEEDIKIRKWSPNINTLLVQIREEILELSQSLQNPQIMEADSNIEENIKYLKGSKETLVALTERCEQIQKYQRSLQLKVSPIDELTVVSQDLNIKLLLWVSFQEWLVLTKKWTPTPYKNINIEEFTEELQKFTRITIQVNSGLPNHPLAPVFKQNVSQFSEILPVIVALTNPHLTTQHWNKIETLTGLAKLQESNFTLNYLMDKHISIYADQIDSIANDATNEAILLKMLREIEVTWETIEFVMVLHKEIKDFYLVGSLDDVIAQLEETQVQLSTIRSSRYVNAIKAQVDDDSRAMNQLAKCLDYITDFQITFNSLAKVFASSDIQRELAPEAKELALLERSYKQWGHHARDAPRVYKLCANLKAVQMFEGYLETTDKIQKALEAFLQKKRTAFPRFYFLSNENLLKIFAEARNPKAVQPFLPKLFEGIQTLQFSANGQDILSMTSPEGEVITFGKTQTLGAIEVWLGGMEKSMRLALHRVLKAGRTTYGDMSRTDWIQQNPAQVVTVITQIYFSLLVEECFEKPNPLEALNELREKQEAQLVALADLVRCDLSRSLHSAIVALITLDVHSRDIVSELIDEEVTTVDNFEWTKRLRYYWDDETNRVKLCQGNSSIEYGYEYLGATSRLVVTPLTERCYLTLTSALQFYLGGSPAGPAGTGKTETVKDLSKAVGNFCVVFNCSDAVTVIQMESFFSGLAQTGAWACFDEFNRINSEVLSVIAEQVYAVQAAVASGLTQFTFCGSNIPLNPRCGVFITMNPGYAGRTELPDNLKSLFRPIAMMVPDYAMIAEVVLYSEGFNNAKPLAKKVTQLYKLSSEMLSKQSHYDFGMRALKSILVMAGSMKRRNPELNEDILFIRAMRDSNISKLLIDDAKIFNAIVGDLFPGIECEDETYEELIDAISSVIKNKNLQHSDFLLTKTIQLYQTINIRHGVMLVGPTGGGKTTSRNILAAALEVLGSPVEAYEINPKSVSLTDLYGAYNLTTGDWKNGLVGKYFSEMAEADPKYKEWIIFDGPVDALWIENMNTVLDDNKLLSLANSDRIKMTDQMELLFEVGDLEQASPATVSRCGMVYYQPEDLGWRPLIFAWIDNQPEIIREVYKELFELTFDNAIKTLTEVCKTVVKPIIWNIASSVCEFITAMMTEQEIDINSFHDDIRNKVVAHIYAFALAWSFGGIVTDETRADFDAFMRDHFERKINYPARHMIFDYALIINELRFKLWSDYIQETEVKDIIPTSDTIRFSSILTTLIKHKRPVLFLGESGCGKTSIINSALHAQSQNIYSIIFTLSARTSSDQLQDLIEAKMQSKRKTLYGPPEGKSAVMLIDDFNLPRPDTYWSQPPIEILRQVINCKGLYNRDELFWYNIDNLTIVASGISQGHVTPRFTSRFTILSLPAPSDAVLTRIFSEILNKFLSGGFVDPVVAMSDNIVRASVVFYRKIKVELLPTPSRSHYTFNLRDITRVFNGITMSNINSLSDPKSFVKLWFHENLRVFGDRLVDKKDRDLLQSSMYEVAKSQLHVKDEISSFFGEEPLIWTDLLKGYGADPAQRSYQESVSMMQLSAALKTFAEIYRTPIVLFQQCIEHVNRIVRCLRQPLGHMLLVGMGGTGKRTIARFAAFVAELEIFEPQPGKEYRIQEFRNDLRGLFKTAGCQNKPIMFLLTDEQIVDESFLEDINNILNSGEVPGLFEAEEYDQMVNELVPMMKKTGESLAYDSLCRRFTQNIMSNLHVVLAMSPIGGRFRDRCRIFPSLVSCCTIDWFDPWPATALKTVAAEFIGKMDLARYGENAKGALIELSPFAHTQVVEAASKFQSELNRIYYVTPAVYVEFFSLFSSTLSKRVADHDLKKDQLQKGIEKLQETNEKVQEMEAELQNLRPMLQKKAAETEALLAKLKVDREKVNAAHQQIKAEEEVVNKVRDEATELAAEAQKDLDLAMPFLRGALEAVEDLKNKKSDLAVVKTFVKPPQLVIEIMEAVCLLNGAKPDWSSAKQLLSQTDFFNRLLEVHTKPIPESTLAKIRSMGADPKFEISKVMGVSGSAACLFKWVTAIEKYVSESVKIAPKIKRRDDAKAAQEEAETKLKQKQDELAEISARLQELQRTYDVSMAQQKELQQKIDQCEYRLKNASQLTTALDSERVRWSENLVELNEKEKCLLGDAVLIALHVAYIGPFSYPYRSSIIENWLKELDRLELKYSTNFLLEGIACEPVTLREWQVCGLPDDALSRQNGVLVTSSGRWPLLIDPQGQGRNWLLKMSDIKLVRCDDPNYVRDIINAIKLGTSILVEDVGEVLDPGLQFILVPKMKVQGGRKSIRVGDKWVEYDPQFKLFITTKLSNPQYLPDVFIQLSVINFSVTLEGLEEQLLGDVVLHEMPDLENQRSELIVAISKDQKQLQELMAQILHLLFTSRGNILDNEKLIKTLHNAKETSTQVGERLIEAEKTEKEIAEKREVYRSVATRGSVLYFVVLELPGIDSMYQYSLEFFKRIFKSVLDSTEENESIETRCLAFIDRTTYAVYSNVSRGLFANHRQVFSFLIATWLLRSTDKITEDQWRLFIRGPHNVDIEKFESPDPRIEPRIWLKACALSKASSEYTTLPMELNNKYDQWVDYITGHTMELPKPFNGLNIFTQLTIASCISRRKIVSLSRTLIKEVLGDKFIASANVDLESPFSDTSNDTPLLFILSQGADPRESLENLAQKNGYGDKLNILSLGQGRGPTASKLIKTAKQEGRWVFLQNCHLCPSFLPKLEHIVQKMNQTASKFNPKFRLFLSSMPTEEFPISVLRNSVKVTSEPPSGIKPNVSLLLNTLNSERWESCSRIRPWKKLIFATALFHSTIQERKRYGALGFNKIYEWNTSDFSIAIKVLHAFLSQHEQVPWQALTTMIGGVIYGGRVTDDWDRRCMNALLDKFVNQSVLQDGISFDSEENYKTPNLGTFQQVLEFVETLPMEDPPSIFGFHPTALNALNLQQSNQMMEWILGVQPRDSGGSAAAKDDDTVYQIAEELDSQLPIQILTNNASPTLFEEPEYSDQPNSLTVILFQEVERFNKLITAIHNSLKQVMKAIKGEVVMSIDIADVYRSLLDQQVPKSWKEISYPMLKPLMSWFKDLLARIEFLNMWIKKGEPTVFWFPGFFFPQSFLTAVLQNHSRKHQLPIDRLSFEAHIVRDDPDSISRPPQDGAYIYGLFFDGAKWDTENWRLTDNNTDIVYTSCPVIHIVPVESFVHPKEDYRCPVYRTAERAGVLSTTGHSTNFVIAINLPTADSPNKWTLRGTALLLTTPY